MAEPTHLGAAASSERSERHDANGAAVGGYRRLSVVGGRDALLATKLQMPRVRSDLVARPRLVQRLTDAAQGALTLVSAPAGFGKTSTVAAWVQQVDQPVAWVSLDAGDSDPARFWRYVSAALDDACAGVHQQVAALLDGAQQAPVDHIVALVINAQAAASQGVMLILDDYHLVDSAAVHAGVSDLLDGLPAQSHVVVASRADPPLPLARLRARRQLTEIRAGDLRFTAGEAAELLGVATGEKLPADSVAALTRRTEGWAAGLQLAALSLSGRPDPAAFVAAFTGSNRYVLDYLTEEVLARQPDEIYQFLLETSVLDRLSGPLCDAVTGRDDSQTLLEAVEGANLFLLSLDDERRWWRYHQLFADLLRTRMSKTAPDRVRELHRNAARWFDAHDLSDEAIHHALAAGAPGLAAALIERHLEEQILRRSEGATLRRWLACLPAETTTTQPRLALGQAVAALLSGRLDDVEPLVDTAESQFDAATSDAYEPSVGHAASVLGNVACVIAVCRADLARLRGDPEREAAYAADAQRHLRGIDEVLGTFVRYHHAVAAWMRGRLDAAERGLDAVVEDRVAAGERYLAIRACHDLGHVQQASGRLDAAYETYRYALGLATEPGRPPLPAAGVARLGLAEILYERDDVAGALEHLTDGIAACHTLAYKPPLATGLALLARIRHALGDRDAAIDAIRQAASIMPSHGVADLVNPVASLWARLQLAFGELDAVDRWTRDRGLSADDEPEYPRERAYLVLARLLVTRGSHDAALRLLTRLREHAARDQRWGSLIEIQIMSALAFSASGDTVTATQTLGEAVQRAAAGRHVRVFLDEGPPLADLIGAVVAARRHADGGQAPRAHLSRLIEAFAEHDMPVLRQPREGAVTAPGLIVPLTAREFEVLGLVASGHANRRIADDLFITLDTVKRHVSHILDKLGVNNRTQAVIRARQLGLID